MKTTIGTWFITAQLFIPRRKFVTALFTITLLQLATLHHFLAFADSNITHVYAVQHQIAESLVPAIDGILLPGESVNAYNHSLVVNASAASHRSIETLLRELDTPLRNIMIVVRNDNTGNSTDNGTSVSGGIRTGNVYLGAGGPVYRENRSLGGDDGVVIQSNGVRIRSHRETSNSSTQQEQKLRAIEGSPSWISTGQSIPYRTTDAWGNSTTEYHNADSGFYVTARIMGDRVQLDISTSDDKLSQDPHERRRGIIDTQRLQTSTAGAIGEWISLGGIHLQDADDSEQYTGNHRKTSDSITGISVKIIPID